MSILGKVADCTSEAVINGTAVATAGLTSMYCFEHDPLNDPELSAVAGFTIGAVTGTTVKFIGSQIKYGIQKAYYGNKITKKAKKMVSEC